MSRQSTIHSLTVTVLGMHVGRYIISVDMLNMTSDICHITESPKHQYMYSHQYQVGISYRIKFYDMMRALPAYVFISRADCELLRIVCAGDVVHQVR